MAIPLSHDQCTEYEENLNSLFLLCNRLKLYQLQVAFRIAKKLSLCSLDCKIDWIGKMDEMTNNLMTVKCDNCGNDAGKLNSCTGCMRVFYCDRKCKKISLET